ncbi:MAG: hypothetical protein C0465_25870 [Ralstonia sp.]|uniref:hypothetical protein n=1 Tax=Ralstonia sp. TaxID=54061 RepID=UPI000D26D857|nr:hypothetical protein [Ralstonia sp.]MBA4234004.1 hypothetical protein [Ralstonia sp.]PPD32343.1 MAG: hypothetical protein CTY21_11510 [Methylomonas sp.]
MKRLQSFSTAVAIGVALMVGAAVARDFESSLGVRPTHVEVRPNPSTGRTTEQDNIAGRYNQDNKPGSVKHFYVLSPRTGAVILYSSVEGKVTSGGKRLTPRTSIEKYDCGKDCTHYEGMRVLIGGEMQITTEMMQDDGTFGNSVPYFYWFDTQGRYHQHFFTEGQVIAILDQPLVGKSVTINADVTAPK